MNAFLKNVDGVLKTPLLTLGGSSVTPGDVLQFVAMLLLVFLADRIFRRLVLRRALTRMPLSPSSRFGIERLTSYVILTLGFCLALKASGVNLSSLALIAGGLGVGLGLGLQNIFGNFVSGIVILIGRPIAIGDRVDVGGVAGQVVEIRLRSTVVVTNDNIAIIVPNSKFISESVTNWNYGDPKVRFRFPFGVAYGTDTARLQEITRRVALAEPGVLAEPEPYLIFVEFGESSLNFELAVWTVSMAHAPMILRSRLNYALDAAFREAGIEVPFPQRDIHIRTAPTPERGADR